MREGNEMNTGLTLRATPAPGAEKRLKIRWGELGQPTEPCFREYNGDLVEVRQRDIDVAAANPDAVFTASRVRLWTGPAYYRLGEVSLSSATNEARPKDRDGSRRVLIRWSHLGSPAKPGRYGFEEAVVDVRAKDIAAANNDPNTVFTATQIRPHVGRPYYVLGMVKIPENSARHAKVA